MPLQQGDFRIWGAQSARAGTDVAPHEGQTPRLPDEYLPLVQESASSLVYPVLKRPDEKFVTEYSYENPRFVEDVARELALRLSEREELSGFRVECESIESIHNHNAFAMYESPRRK